MQTVIYASQVFRRWISFLRDIRAYLPNLSWWIPRDCLLRILSMFWLHCSRKRMQTFKLNLFFFVWEIFNILYFFSGAYLGPGNQSFARLLIAFLHFFKFEYMLFNILWIKYLYLKKMHNLWLQHFNFGCKHSIFLFKIISKMQDLFLEILDFN